MAESKDAIRVGAVEALYRYPVKSMAGEAVDEVELGWHGLVGDRRLALRRVGDRRGFPWLTASRLGELIRFTPVRRGADALPTHVRTPEGDELELFGPALAEDVGGRFGAALEMTHLDRGIFDEASVSAITAATVDAIATLAGQDADVRRFRPNVLISTERAAPFEEDGWVGGVLTFGEDAEAPAIAITNWDVRCPMVDLDPDSGRPTPGVLEAVVRERENRAGIYATVLRRGRLSVGQPIGFTPGADRPGAGGR